MTRDAIADRLVSYSDATDPEAARTLGYLHLARIGIVWSTALACIPLVRMAITDTCDRAAG